MALGAKKKRRGGFRRALRVVAIGLGAALLALGVWEAFFLRIGALRDPAHTRTISVPAGREGTRELVVGPRNPYWTPLGRVAAIVPQAVVKAEDGSFWEHDGFDWVELQKSWERNVEEGKPVRGGSTITMQLAKNLFLWRDKSVVRKALEAYVTWRLEQTLEKRRILELYLNVVEWGPGIYGIGEASRRYFEKSPAELTIGEAALLAVTLPSPLRSNPGRVTDYLQRRQQELLGRIYRSDPLD